MILSEEVKEIEIEEHTAKRGGFANIHYGYYFS